MYAMHDRACATRQSYRASIGGSASSPNPSFGSNGPIQASLRIGILTESLIRLEWSDSGEFEDRLTQMAVNRDFGADPEFTVTHRNGLLIVDTPALYLTYDGKPFSKEGLSIVVKGVSDTQFNTWHYGDAPLHNLKGTARTLDEADGEIALDDGVLSRDGWAVIDDSGSNVIVEADEVDGKTNSDSVPNCWWHPS